MPIWLHKAVPNRSVIPLCNAVDYILDSFPIVRRKDEEKCNGDNRTKRNILEI